jgi:hypothetical protein
VQTTPFTPTATQLASFAGTYRSSELDTDLRITAKDSSLVLRGNRLDPLVMRPVYLDAFRGGPVVVDFARDASGRVTGFVANAGRVRGLRFDRIE